MVLLLQTAGGGGGGHYHLHLTWQMITTLGYQVTKIQGLNVRSVSGCWRSITSFHNVFSLFRAFSRLEERRQSAQWVTEINDNVGRAQKHTGSRQDCWYKRKWSWSPRFYRSPAERRDEGETFPHYGNTFLLSDFCGDFYLINSLNLSPNV